jgi:Alg9-like mannosyltransferase family
MPPSLLSANGVASKGRQRTDRAVETISSQNILLLIVALRILNALSIQTFFQPDEYFQSLEPAWQMVFGEESGAWITWVHAPLTVTRHFWTGADFYSPTRKLGVETPIAFVHPPSSLCGCLLYIFKPSWPAWTFSMDASGTSTSSSKGDTGSYRSLGRLLHLEARRAGIWAREPSGVGHCM